MIDPVNFELRKTGIGSSEAAALIGLSPWQTAWNIYALKVGLIDPPLPTRRMLWGTRLEQAIAEGFSEETGLPVEWRNVTVRHPERPWQMATPDAIITTHPRELLEVKTVGLDRAGEWQASGAGEDGVPAHYAVQAHWQMSVTRLSACHIAALIAGNDFRMYKILYDGEIERVLVEAGERFWREHVEKRIPPEMGASREARDYLQRRYPQHSMPLREATPKEQALLNEYAQVRRRHRVWEQEREVLETQIKQAIGDSEGLKWPGGKFTWKRTKDQIWTDWERLAKKLLRDVPQDERQALVDEHAEREEGVRRIWFSPNEKEAA